MRKWSRLLATAVAIAAVAVPLTGGAAQAAPAPEAVAPAACVRMASNQSLIPKYSLFHGIMVRNGSFGGQFTTCRTLGVFVSVRGTSYWVERNRVHRI